VLKLDDDAEKTPEHKSSLELIQSHSFRVYQWRWNVSFEDPPGDTDNSVNWHDRWSCVSFDLSCLVPNI
jgi:hypothetical protein